MLAKSARYDEAIFASGRTLNTRVTVLGKDREPKAILPVHASEGANVDRTASNPRTITIEVAGGEYAPDSLDDLLAPGVNRLHVEVGLRIEDTAIVAQTNGPGHGWGVTDQSTGVLNGLKETPEGWLSLGP